MSIADVVRLEVEVVKRVWEALIAVAALVVLAPGIVFAQASVTGTVRDPSGAVLPGVSVEASSDALIEKVRSGVTDGTGQYRITDLPPGAYRVNFSLSGFTTVQRDGIELSGNFTATVSVEMRVGGIQETITITGEAPIVDVQSTVRQDVLTGGLITELPAARNIQNVAILIPGMNVTGTLDVGGLRGGVSISAWGYTMATQYWAGSARKNDSNTLPLVTASTRRNASRRIAQRTRF